MTAGRETARGGWSFVPRRAARIAAVAVLATLAGSCSGTSSTTSSATGGNAARGTTVGEGEGLSTGGGTGWDCPSGTCAWSDDASIESTTETSIAGGAVPPTSVTRAPDATTTTRTGASPTKGGTFALPASAASVDDNAAFPAYLAYRRQAEALGVRFVPLEVAQRHVISVVDPTGKAVLGANVVVTDPAGAVVGLVKTYADGRALFVPPPGTADGVTFDVAATKGGVTASAPLRPGADDVVITLAAPAAPVDLDVLFVLDGTGSMDDEIKQLQDGIGPLAAALQQRAAGGTVHFGLTVYRDRNELFVTRTFNFTPDVAAFTRALQEVQVGGGGDTPEDLNAALHDALTKPSWRFGETVKLLFLVGDAPPHLDYADGVPYADSVTSATQQGVKIMAIGASGLGDQGEYVFRQVAQATMGRFVLLTSGTTGSRPVSGRSHEITPDDYSSLGLDELVVRLATEELALDHG